MGAMVRERDEMAQRVAMLEQRAQAIAPQQPPPDPQLVQAIQQEAQKLAQQMRQQDRIKDFHEQGQLQFPDWQQRCNDLQAMGADAQLSHLLVEMPGGPRIAAALRDYGAAFAAL